VSGRGATAAVLAEIAKPELRCAHLFEFRFNPTVYMTDAWRELTWSGNTYLASKYPLQMSGIPESSELLVNSITVSLSGVDQVIVALLLQESYFDRRVRVHKVLLDEALSIIPEPVLIFDGRMNRPVIQVSPDDGSVVCAVECVSIWTDFERRPGRHTNDAEQQSYFPGDRGFEKVGRIPATIFWGQRTNLDREGAAPTRRSRRRD